MLIDVVMGNIDWIVVAACAVAALRYAPELIAYGWYTGKLRAHKGKVITTYTINCNMDEFEKLKEQHKL